MAYQTTVISVRQRCYEEGIAICLGIRSQPGTLIGSRPGPYELPRIPVPRSWVNKGKKKGQRVKEKKLTKRIGARVQPRFFYVTLVYED
jgi:hypothetical protein